MPRFTFSLFIALLLSVVANAESGPRVVHLWENGAPGFEKLKDEPEIAKDWWVRNINNPSVTVFAPPPERANGCAVVIAPGGGFTTCNFLPDGKEPAEYLTSLGVTCFVLKYRLPNDKNPYELEHVRQDAFRAMRLVRCRANEFGIDPHRIGMLGFSAGTTVVTLVSLDNAAGDPKAPDPIDRADGRPDFQILVYPSGENLLSKTTPANAPPAFIICANDDEYGCDKVALNLLERFRNANVSVEAHFVAQGKHGFGIGLHTAFATIRNWPSLMADWLNDRGLFVQKTSANPGNR